MEHAVKETTACEKGDRLSLSSHDTMGSVMFVPKSIFYQVRKVFTFLEVEKLRRGDRNPIDSA